VQLLIDRPSVSGRNSAATAQDASSQQERIFHQLQSSLKELDKKLFGSAVLILIWGQEMGIYDIP
jgi:hypothetical protein